MISVKGVARAVIVVAAVVLAAGGARADVFNMGAGLTSLEFVTVDNADNDPDDTGYGAVAYEYNIGKYEVTAGQYCEFLNAVAVTDTYGLYNTNMWSSDYGCKVERTDTGSGYSYSVASDWANRPVNYVSWGDAARFANWLTNGQPTGVQGLSTTEDGSYYLNGATTNAALLAVTRKANARYVIPTEDEWYKAAYHKNDGVTGNYWDYPTGTNSVPSNDLVDPDPGNNANFAVSWPGDVTIGSPYWRTPVGEFENSESPYGTFDQGGNVWEWNEAILSGSHRGDRGGSFNHGDDGMLVAYRHHNSPANEPLSMGFRVATPEPATLLLLALGGAALAARRRKG